VHIRSVLALSRPTLLALFAFGVAFGSIGGVLLGGVADARDKSGACYLDAKPRYPGDDAARAEIAEWMGAAALAAGLPAELPVMAALETSGLRNTARDGDSVGFFQMRIGIWDRGEFAGYATSPELQLKWFIDSAIAVKQIRFGLGVDPADPTTWGEWIADVERPAEQYRGRYQLRLAEARDLLRK
jgi:hypothetical protein